MDICYNVLAAVVYHPRNNNSCTKYFLLIYRSVGAPHVAMCEAYLIDKIIKMVNGYCASSTAGI